MLFYLFLLFSCSDGEIPSPIGSWSINCDNDSALTYVFYANGSYSITGNREFSTGKWEHSNTQFYISPKGAHTSQYDLLKLTQSELYLRDSPESDIIKLNKCREVKHGY